MSDSPVWDFSSDLEEPPRKRRNTKRGPPKLTPALYRAVVTKLADAGTIRVSSSTADVDNAVLQRIKKCLQRANHPNTPEAEAKAAFHLASRMMSQYNVTQAEALADECEDEQRKYAGQSRVAIERADSDSSKRVKYQGYVTELARAMEKFFDCKSYSSQSNRMEWTFYGIAENTIAAAMTFEMAYNLICEWARSYTGIASKNSYCIGVAEELHRTARREMRDQEKQAREAEVASMQARIRQEQAERQAQLDRLNAPPGDDTRSTAPAVELAHSTEGFRSDHDDARDITSQRAHGEDEISNIDQDLVDEDDESDAGDYAQPDFSQNDTVHIDLTGDIDDEIMKLVKPEPTDSKGPLSVIDPPPPPTSPKTHPSGTQVAGAGYASPVSIKQEEEEDAKDTSLWASSMQLITFRATASKIADDFLESKGLKLKSRKSKTSGVSDFAAYEQGILDSKKIDVRRKRIQAQDNS